MRCYPHFPALLVLLFVAHHLGAQPVPVPGLAGAGGYYIFTVHPPARGEAVVWQYGDLTLTTHRLVDRSDSTVLHLAPPTHLTLRTFVQSGADAGAGWRMEEQGLGETGEVLVYPTLLSPGQRQLTESYLALRHGITLNQGLPTNYLAPAAEGGSYPVWTATAAPEFRHRIVGLAVDTTAGLLRTAGYSVLAPELLQLRWREAPAATAYFVVADDGAPTARRADRLQRRWRVETHGAVPDTTWLSIQPRSLFERLATGEGWALAVELADGQTVLLPPTPSEGELLFPLPAGTAYFQLAITGARTDGPTEDPALAHLSPNPVAVGQATQLRIALAVPQALHLSAYDLNGRQLEERWLPPTTHHLTELTFPAPGTYTLHLRPRPHGPTQALFVVVQ
ncbi:hypothetical protein QWY85_06345 [Neolewinella lacunae]|uniref:DUF8202 domain-containing protein n=1 Tax=Neolewinella lacunae TaxID=1517758 RepID=A0A923PRY2_9BACT|nr:hypothetical protein [Neolewinella lacunae]MBC6995662.1 hypothetical protein [Neolewinella lacunae]MDN3634271.1 hypothetical protein [Neolewinella lacunae]